MIQKPDLVLIPGLLCDPDLWRDQVAQFKDRWTIHIPLLTQQPTMAEMAQAAIAPTQGRPFALMGLSMGGHVAFEIMRQVTAQASERVTHLAVLDSSARSDSPDQTRQREQFIAMAQVGAFMGVTDRLMPRLVHSDRLTDDALTDRIKAMAQTIGRQGFYNQMHAIMSRPDSRACLRSITCPTLIICGADDVLTAPHLSDEMTSMIPNARLELITDCGHLSTMERPKQVNTLLEQLLQL